MNRKNKDINQLLKNGYEIECNNLIDENAIYCRLNGPKDTYYEDGSWIIRIEFLSDYPFKSPSIGFTTKIFHPNIDENSGTICMDTLNQEWTPMYDLTNIFDYFLPQLLTYPNPDDPLNYIAAGIYKKNENRYKDIVKSYINKYCK